MEQRAFVAAFERPARRPRAQPWPGLAAHGLRILAILLFAAFIIGLQPMKLDACSAGEVGVCGP